MILRYIYILLLIIVLIGQGCAFTKRTVIEIEGKDVHFPMSGFRTIEGDVDITITREATFYIFVFFKHESKIHN